MAMSPAMLEALKSRNPTLVHLIRIDLTARTIFLCDGAGFVNWGGDEYLGEDPDFGSIAEIGDFYETEGTESPRQEVSLFVPNTSALATLASPLAQGTPVSIYAAVIDPSNGQIIGEPDARFIGEIDDATARFDRNQRLLTLELSTVWEMLFDNNEGARWNDTFWRYLYGSNAGAFSHVTNANQKLFWGYNGPNNGSGGSNYGGGGFVGGGGTVSYVE